MPRLAGRVFAFTCAASLVLCLATTILWVRSIWRADLIAAKTSHRIILRSEPGLLFLDVYRVDGRRMDWWYDTWPHAPGWSAWSRLDRRWWGRLGFGHHIGWADTG